MSVKKFLQWIYYRCLEGVGFFFLAAMRVLPPRLFRRLCALISKLLIIILLSRRRILKNLSAVFGETYALATKKGMAKGVQEQFAKNLTDCFSQVANPEHARETVSIEGLENLQAGIAKGKGVLALGAHIGNFVLVGTRLRSEGYPISSLFRMPSDEGIKNLIDRILSPLRQQVIASRPRRLAVRRVLEALKRNEIVFILGDNLKRGKIQTVLFDQNVPSPRGPVSLALRSGAALIPMYLIRNYQGGLQLVIEPEILLIRNGNMYEDITRNTRQIVRYLETLIGRYPDQWNWLTVRMKKTRAGSGLTAPRESRPISQDRED